MTNVKKVGGIQLDPSRNPGVLDTLSWDFEGVVSYLNTAWDRLKPLFEAMASSCCRDAIATALKLAPPELSVFSGSSALTRAAAYMLAKCPDSQRVLLGVRRIGAEDGSGPIDIELQGGRLIGSGSPAVYAFPVDTEVIHSFITEIQPGFGLRALGTTSRLGVGARQTLAVWPGIFEAMEEIRIPSEIVQNSAYRELAPLEEIVSPATGAVTTYLPGHGSVSVGHTGSSIEGLWLAGVVSAMEFGFGEPFGADLDHIPVKSTSPEGVDKAKRLISAGRYYTFFTLDASDLFNFKALGLGGQDLEDSFSAAVPRDMRKGLIERHIRRGLSESRIKQLAATYFASIEAAGEIYGYIKEQKGSEPFDFEFSLDEGPKITGLDELAFIMEELAHQGVAVNFIAPNVGFEKRYDYRRADGLDGLSKRVSRLSAVAGEYGAFLDFHSGSDKSSATYQAVSLAAKGRLKLKVSGKLQLILAETLFDLDPAFFRDWWDWSLVAAREEARAGNPVAVDYVNQVEARMAAEGARFLRSPKDRFFMDFSFGMVGARDKDGDFLYRDRFYSLSPAILDEYRKRVRAYLTQLAADLGLSP